MQDADPPIAELLKPLGYTLAQIDKKHAGDRNEYLPTVHGFDEFSDILYGGAVRQRVPLGRRS